MKARWVDGHAYCGRQGCGDDLQAIRAANPTQGGVSIYLSDTFEPTFGPRGTIYALRLKARKAQRVGMAPHRHRTKSPRGWVVPGLPPIRNSLQFPAGQAVWVKCPAHQHPNEVLTA